MSAVGTHPLEAAYERLWDDGRSALEAGVTSPEPAVEEGSPRWGVSAVLRPVGTVADALAEAAREADSRAGGGHIVYAAGGLHVTVRSIEGYRSDVPRDDPRVAEYGRILRGAARDLGPVAIEFRGIVATPTAVLVQGFPVGEALAELREAMHDGLVGAGLPLGPEAAQRRETAHATLLMVTRRLPDPAAFAAYVDERRRVPFGTCTFDAVDLVRYRRAATNVALVDLDTIPLPPS